MIKQFKKKPVIIDCVQWDGTEDSWNSIINMGCSLIQDETCEMYEVIIPTLEDGSKSQVKHIASKGDWIIKGVHGEFYPCKPDIFEKIYEEAFVKTEAESLVTHVVKQNWKSTHEGQDGPSCYEHNQNTSLKCFLGPNGHLNITLYHQGENESFFENNTVSINDYFTILKLLKISF